MSTILTAFGPVDHPRELLKALRSDENTVHFHCSDGEFSSSVLLLAAVSPLIQEIGRQISSCDFEDFNLLLPDHSVTGKSFSEELILASTNPQYDKRLFIELEVQYMKILSSEHAVYINCSESQNKNKKQFVYTICSELAIFMY